VAYGGDFIHGVDGDTRRRRAGVIQGKLPAVE
jgi:hypothetical protein